MKIAVIGAGAMGSVYAGLLGDAGNDVWAVDVDAAHIAEIRENGLRIEGASGNRTVRVRAATDAREVGPCDLAIVATKVRHVADAARAARSVLGPDTPVLTIQNGIGGVDAAAGVLGPERVAVGVAGGFGARLVGPGRARHEGMELIRLGESAGPATPRLRAIAEVWSKAGFNVRLFDDIHRLIWEKLICNGAFGAVCALTRMTVGEVLASDEAWPVAAACAREGDAVARARKIALGFEDAEAYVRDFGAKIPDGRPSMRQDLEAGRPSEIDAINGGIAKAGREAGVATPTHDLLVRLVRAAEAAAGA